ncbi:hypothetical protein AVEN_54951-1 [Araneus ventricosus]|uniref:Transmembrane protein n=1 Tax=Araneus ventricosus TaxID=182803 RepID=A0A4Y2HT50_ARAVE|nr:hypothetical protein AVEN_54951-1 [Araneus ventricosus]
MSGYLDLVGSARWKVERYGGRKRCMFSLMNLTILPIICLVTRLLVTLFSHSCSKFGIGFLIFQDTVRIHSVEIIEVVSRSYTVRIHSEVPYQFHHNSNNHCQRGKIFEVGKERAMLRKEDNILSNPVSGTETN